MGRAAVARMRAVATALVMIASLAGAMPASGDDRPKTRIVIKTLKQSGASGKVSSSNNGCLNNRKVSLFGLEGYVSNKVAITHTSSNGKWKVKKDLRDGRYFAKVDSGNGCRYDNSKNETLS